MSDAASRKTSASRSFVAAGGGDDREEYDYWTAGEAIRNARATADVIVAEAIRVVGPDGEQIDWKANPALVVHPASRL